MAWRGGQSGLRVTAKEDDDAGRDEMWKEGGGERGGNSEACHSEQTRRLQGFTRLGEILAAASRTAIVNKGASSEERDATVGRSSALRLALRPLTMRYPSFYRDTK